MIWTILINELEISASIGIYAHERKSAQRIFITLECTYETEFVPHKIDDACCYEAISQNIKSLALKQHFDLVETLIEEIANLCFQNQSIKWLKIKIEKPLAITNAKSAGIEIVRAR